MKEKRYPNAISFSERLREEDINENRNISCTAKTIQRDIRILKDDFNQGGFNSPTLWVVK